MLMLFRASPLPFTRTIGTTGATVACMPIAAGTPRAAVRGGITSNATGRAGGEVEKCPSSGCMRAASLTCDLRGLSGYCRLRCLWRPRLGKR